MNAPTRLLVAGTIVLLTLIGFFQFPGHTFLQSDTQIYVPILERFWDPGAFAREPIAQEPHVAFTIYDEMALALRRLTGADFRTVLTAQQLVFRALGLLGVFLIAASLRLRTSHALLVTAAFSLGTAIAGPAVLTIEYEPVPRGFAIPLLLLAIGLVAHGRDLAAGFAAAIAFLYHPPTVLPFWAVYFALTLWPAKPAIMSRRIAGLAPMLAGVAVLFVLSRAQTGGAEHQDFFGRIGPELERIQRLRAAYNWVSLWPRYLIAYYLFLWALSLAAFARLRKSIPQDLRFFLLGLPLIGLLMPPLCYLLLEKLKWIVIPQAQPARALLFVVAVALILAAAAAMKAAAERRWWESFLWLAPVYALPAQPLNAKRVAIALAFAALTAFAAWACTRARRWAAAPWAAALIVPAFLLPGWGEVRNYPPLHTPELARLSEWARESTPKDAVFFFPAAGRNLAPGVFRAQALRALYVDWKAGGQANFLKDYAREWWNRWNDSGSYNSTILPLDRYRALGIDYIVVAPAARIPARAPAYENARYIVYRTAT